MSTNPATKNNKFENMPDINTDFPSGTVRLVQITDSHLYNTENKNLLGINTLQSLRQVITKAQNDAWSFDMVLATGDLAQESSQASYQSVMREFCRLNIPVYALPGNHDHLQTMQSVFTKQNIQLPPDIELAHWHLVFLNSVIIGSEGGHLAKTELARLKKVLDNTDKHVLIALHHQPVAIGSRWLDTMRVDNGDALLQLVSQYDRAKALLWGHIHQAFDANVENIKLMATPSTCIQFKPQSKEFALDVIPPGYRRLALQPNGDIYSDVIRTDDMPEGLDHNSGGY